MKVLADDKILKVLVDELILKVPADEGPSHHLQVEPLAIQLHHHCLCHWVFQDQHIQHILNDLLIIGVTLL